MSGGINYNCFAYNNKKNKCEALDNLYCRSEKCRFYKTEKQNYEEDLCARRIKKYMKYFN